MSVFTSCWQSIFLLTYGGRVGTWAGSVAAGVCMRVWIYQGVWRKHVPWTQIHSQPDDLLRTWQLLLWCHGRSLYQFVNWPSCALTKAVVSLPASCNCSPRAVPHHGHLPCGRNIQKVISCTAKGHLGEWRGYVRTQRCGFPNLQLSTTWI